MEYKGDFITMDNYRVFMGHIEIESGINKDLFLVIIERRIWNLGIVSAD